MKKTLSLMALVCATGIAWSQEAVVHINERALYGDTVFVNPGESFVLTANPYIPVKYFNGLYTVDTIAYNPVDTSFSAGTIVPGSYDDRFSSWDTLPFPFYFFGEAQNGYCVGENGMLSFNDYAAGQMCEYNYSAGLPWPDGTSGAPNNLTYMRKAIYGVYQDNFSSTYTVNPDGIYRGIIGTFPRRKLVCSWNNVPVYNSSTFRSTYQIVCYEATNIIEVHVKKRSVGTTSWGVYGIIGIQNATGQPQVRGALGTTTMYVNDNSPAAFFPTGYNPATTAFDSVAFRFTPQGISTRMLEWYRLLSNGDIVHLTTDITAADGYYTVVESASTDSVLTTAVVRPNGIERFVCHLRFSDASNTLYDLYDTICLRTTIPATVTALANDDTLGSTLGSGIYSQGDTVTLMALPQVGTLFQGWDNGSTANPYLLAVDGDTTVTALFSVCANDTLYIHDTVYVGVDEVTLMPVTLYADGGDIVVGGADGRTVQLFDAVGRLLAVKPSAEGLVRFSVPASGTYMIQVDGLPVRRIVIVK